MALIGWDSAAYKCRSRDNWLGWTEEQKQQHLKYIAKNQRFLILPGVHIPNLASKVLALNLMHLPADWQAVHGHPVLLAETFVDHHRFRGTCYRAGGW
ncbi:Druantia anti-phage system protein DruA [Desulfofundulus kuznetsovii]|uniref:Druantia anti-phage system protein DruA n=1 Tax=Desulfofundulus kuznetsovii TaxID=58135 RepID=UPI00338DC4BB